MATSIFQRLIMGKVENDHFFCLGGNICIFNFTEMFIESSSTFYMSFVQIAEFNWLVARAGKRVNV